MLKTTRNIKRSVAIAVIFSKDKPTEQNTETEGKENRNPHPTDSAHSITSWHTGEPACYCPAAEEHEKRHKRDKRHNKSCFGGDIHDRIRRRQICAIRHNPKPLIARVTKRQGRDTTVMTMGNSKASGWLLRY